MTSEAPRLPKLVGKGFALFVIAALAVVAVASIYRRVAPRIAAEPAYSAIIDCQDRHNVKIEWETPPGGFFDTDYGHFYARSEPEVETAKCILRNASNFVEKDHRDVRCNDPTAPFAIARMISGTHILPPQHDISFHRVRCPPEELEPLPPVNG